MSKKQLTIQERVDRLLQHGVDNPKMWAAVHGYEEPEEWRVNLVDEGWRDEWERLRAHHLAETNFLFDVVRELKKRLDQADEQFANAIILANGEDD